MFAPHLHGPLATAHRLLAFVGAIAITAALSPVPSAASFARAVTSATSGVQERDDAQDSMWGERDVDDAALPSAAQAGMDMQPMAARPQHRFRAPVRATIVSQAVVRQGSYLPMHVPNNLALGTNVRRLL